MLQYYREILNFCMRSIRERHAAEDVAQESYSRVLEMQQAGQPIVHPRALLKTVAQRILIDRSRRATLRQHEDIDALDEASVPAVPHHCQPEAVYASKQEIQAYLQAIQTLPPRCQTAFCFYVFDGLRAGDIALRMGISPSMANQYIRRGKLACMDCREQLEGTLQAPSE